MITKVKIHKSELAEVTPGKAKAFNFDNLKIVISNVDGNYYAVSDVCSHDDGELVSMCAELINNCELQCPRHGARFDVKTGKATQMPAVTPINTYKIDLLGDDIEVLINV